jgi:predicted regulator of Ras-like GTPase activity (Roadblock/LC7/MglB family)
MNRSIVARSLIPRLLEVDGTRACLIATDDGLLVDGRGGDTDLSAAAAIGTYVLNAARRLSQLEGQDHPARLTMEAGGRTILLERMDDEMMLMVTLDDPVNVPYVRYLLDGRSNRVTES